MKQLNLYIEQGSDFIKNIILHDKNDIPLNLNDKTITLNGTCYYDITVVDGTIVTIGAIGLIKVNFNVL